jgi:hypothetical protein
VSVLDSETLALMALGYRAASYLELYCPDHGAIRCAVEGEGPSRLRLFSTAAPKPGVDRGRITVSFHEGGAHKSSVGTLQLHPLAVMPVPGDGCLLKESVVDAVMIDPRRP